MTKENDHSHKGTTGARSPADESKAFLDRIIASGEVEDATEEALRQGLGAIIITGIRGLSEDDVAGGRGASIGESRGTLGEPCPSAPSQSDDESQ